MSKLFDEKDAAYVPEEDGDDVQSDTEQVHDEDYLLRITKLKEDLKICTKERKECLDGWQRAKADYLNSRKRFEEERIEANLRSESKVIEKLLPLCDSFEMALQGHEVQNEKEDTQWHKGLIQIRNQLTSILKELQVEGIDAHGEVFDPQKHEALSSQKVNEAEKHDTVVQVLQKGYTHRGVLIRPAKVIIGNYEA